MFLCICPYYLKRYSVLECNKYYSSSTTLSYPGYFEMTVLYDQEILVPS